jgi:hypothetical protein
MIRSFCCVVFKLRKHDTRQSTKAEIGLELGLDTFVYAAKIARKYVGIRQVDHDSERSSGSTSGKSGQDP